MKTRLFLVLLLVSSVGLAQLIRRGGGAVSVATIDSLVTVYLAAHPPAAYDTTAGLAYVKSQITGKYSAADTSAIFTYIKSQLVLKALAASPTFTGTVTLPTGLTGTLRAASGVVSATASDTAGLGASLGAKAALTAVLKNADSSTIRAYSTSLYLGKPLGTGQENYVPKWSAAAGGPVWRADSVGAGAAGLVASDSVIMRGYSNSLYLGKTAFADSARAHSLGVGTLTAGQTVRAASADSVYSSASDTVGLAAALAAKAALTAVLKNADSTGMAKRADTTWMARKDWADGQYMKNSYAINIFFAGLIDSVKTTDTVFVGFVSRAATMDSIVYSGARGQFLKVRLELVDSLYQTAGVTLLDTTTTITQLRKRTSAVAGGSFSLTVGKTVRMVFMTVGTMPKSFNVSILGHR